MQVNWRRIVLLVGVIVILVRVGGTKLEVMMVEMIV